MQENIAAARHLYNECGFAQAVYGKPGDFVDNTVRESAKRTAAKIATKSEIVSHFIKDNKVKVLAARYDLDDGRVEFLT